MKYEITGDQLPVVVCHLQPGEAMITERGAMSWMSSNMRMETHATGGIGRSIGRMFSGESMFQNRYSAEGSEGLIAFASSFPGEIRAIEITPERPIIAQKSAFWHRPKALNSASSSERRSVRVSSAVKDLSCRNSLVPALLS